VLYTHLPFTLYAAPAAEQSAAGAKTASLDASAAAHFVLCDRSIELSFIYARIGPKHNTFYITLMVRQKSIAAGA